MVRMGRSQLSWRTGAMHQTMCIERHVEACQVPMRYVKQMLRRHAMLLPWLAHLRKMTKNTNSVRHIPLDILQYYRYWPQPIPRP